MLPIITRPLENAERSSLGFRVWFRQRQRTYQKVPFDLPAPYFLLEGTAATSPSVFENPGSPKYDAEGIASHCRSRPDLETQAANISYERFRDRTADNASLGVDFVEYHQALDMIVKRTGTLLTAWRKLKKGDFIGVARTFAESHPPKFNAFARGKFSKITELVPRGVSPLKTIANNWLEYHFGWEPLVKDIFDSMEVLQNPVKQFAFLKGRGSTYATERYRNSFSGGINLQSGTTIVRVTHLQGGRVRSVRDAPLHTLEQLGIINPASLLWEVVPFSFVVDWFVNVGDTLRSFTDFAGLDIDHTWSSVIVRSVNDDFFVNTISGLVRKSHASGVYVNRTLGLTSPVIRLKPLHLPSVTRAATAISLLVQGLSNGDKSLKNSFGRSLG